MKINKILLTFFGLLLIVLVVELWYLFFFLPSQSQTNLKQVNVKPTSKPLLNPKELEQTYLKVNPLMAYDSKVIDTMIYYKKGILQKSTVTNTHKGKIVEIDTKGGKAFYDYYDYKLYLRIADINNPNNMSRFYFSEDDLAKTKISPNLTALKVGDVITIEDTFDPIKNEVILSSDQGGYQTKSWGTNRISVVITK